LEDKGMKKMDKKSFIEHVAALSSVPSVQGKVYRSIKVVNEKVKFIREGKSKEESIDLSELYELYQKVSKPTNAEARAYISGRVQSPAVSIINALGKTSTSSHHPISKTDTSKIVAPISDKSAKNAVKDETRFFKALAAVLGSDNLYSNSINKPVTSSHIFFSDNYSDYDFDHSIDANFKSFLLQLNSNFKFYSKSLAHHLDGLSIDHPMYGSRIVEFDEEQHFTPALRVVLNGQVNFINHAFNAYYLETLFDLDYLNQKVLKKHRLKCQFDEYPTDFNTFLEWIANEKESGFIEPKENGFPYHGGRIAQRAYYDGLRNMAHLSPKNKGFQSPLRFPKKYFEDAANCSFSLISEKDLIELIVQFLTRTYGYQI
jgi:hypothetical protein